MPHWMNLDKKDKEPHYKHLTKDYEAKKPDFMSLWSNELEQDGGSSREP